MKTAPTTLLRLLLAALLMTTALAACSDDSGGGNSSPDAEVCDDGDDNDGDGDTDCDDADCDTDDACDDADAEVCDDGDDNDGDGDTDCDDADCADDEACDEPPVVDEVCDDGQDNDSDGDTDCDDDDCADDAACQEETPEVCGDGEDNDGDGDTDCDDADCADEEACQILLCVQVCGDLTACPELTEICGAELVNQVNEGCQQDCELDAEAREGTIAAAALDCDQVVDIVVERLNEGGLCLPDGVEICDDGRDNDGDGDTDCADADCADEETCQVLLCVQVCDDLTACPELTEICGAELANQVNESCQQECELDAEAREGIIANAEIGCDLAVERAVERLNEGGLCLPDGVEICDDGQDNDGDGDADCADDDCIETPACQPQDEVCDDGQDNDQDGDTDCDDADCAEAPNCQLNVEVCNDETDNDDDGDIDCADADCARDPFCLGATPIPEPGDVVQLLGSIENGDPLWERPNANCTARNLDATQHFDTQDIVNLTGADQDIVVTANWLGQNADGFLFAFESPFDANVLDGCLTGNDDLNMNTEQSQVRVVIPDGATLTLVLTSFAALDVIGDYNVIIETLGPPVDICDTATPIEGEGSISGQTLNGNSVFTASEACGGDGNGPESLFSLTLDNTTTVCIDTFGSDFDTVLHVRTQCAEVGSEETCNDDTDGLQSRVEFEAVAGTTYIIMVDGFGNGDFGDFTLGVDFNPCPVPVEPFTTEELQARINVDCGGCHTGGGRSGGLALDDFEAETINVASFAGLDYIEPGSAQDSYLFHKLAGTQADVGGFGSRMPQGGPFWSAEDLDRLAAYIDGLGF